jgi:hypothetical protein
MQILFLFNNRLREEVSLFELSPEIEDRDDNWANHKKTYSE